MNNPSPLEPEGQVPLPRLGARLQGVDAPLPGVRELPKAGWSPPSALRQDPLRQDDYFNLSSVLDRAWRQAAIGKGAVRHGQSLPFEEQPMLSISRLLGSHVGLLYQAIKKAQESQRLPTEVAVKELLGAINYLAGAVIFLEEKHGKAP